MKILQVNKFFYLKGGAEQVMFETAEILLEKGHEIGFFSMKHPYNKTTEYENYFVGNVDFNRRDDIHSIKTAMRVLYSFKARQNIEQLIQTFRPDIAHLHNIYHQISPSIIHSLKKANVPIVMTLHDYKVVCASYSMIANGKICEACRYGKYYNCLYRNCVKASRMKSLLNTVEMYLHHKMLHIYDLVDVFISPSQFLIEKLNYMGFKGRIEHIPNFIDHVRFVPDYGIKEKSISYIGRLSHEKGLNLLIDAMSNIDLTLKIIGEGPLKNELQAKVKYAGANNIVFMGFKSGTELREEICKSLFTVMPSICYENYPLSVIESFALGKPVVGARIGGIPELVKDNITGYTFKPFDAIDLREKIMKLASDPESILQMGKNARNFIENELNPNKHYELLIQAYNLAIGI
jgi:glycosyltransferase involved in cell wall biosynthesis